MSEEDLRALLKVVIRFKFGTDIRKKIEAIKMVRTLIAENFPSEKYEMKFRDGTPGHYYTCPHKLFGLKEAKHLVEEVLKQS